MLVIEGWKLISKKVDLFSKIYPELYLGAFEMTYKERKERKGNGGRKTREK